MRDMNKAECTTADGGYDMTKKIVMGPYYKYNEDSPWFSYSSGVGEVRVIEGVLCHAVNDIEYYDEEEYDVCSQRKIDSRKVTRWEKVGAHQIG